MLQFIKSYWLYLFSFIFIALNSLLIANEFYYLAAIPFILVIVFMAFFKLDKLMWFIVFTTPLSLNIELIAEILVNKQDEAINYTRCCTELKVIEELKDLAYEVCPLHRTDDLDDIIERL